MAFDISRSFQYTQVKLALYIELLVGDDVRKRGRTVEKLDRALHGTQDAPQAWMGGGVGGTW